jgi:outer membrane protein, heavy metal efflux system
MQRAASVEWIGIGALLVAIGLPGLVRAQAPRSTPPIPSPSRSMMMPMDDPAVPDSDPLPMKTAMPRQHVNAPNQDRKPNARPTNGMSMSPGSPAMAPNSMIPSSMVPPGRTRLVPSRSGYTLAQLESIALTANPTLIQAQAQVEASLSKSLQAGLMPNPVMGYVSEQIGAGGGPGETQGGFVEQEIFRGGKLRLSRAKYRQEAVQAEMQVEAQKLRIVNGVRIKYFEVLAAQQRITVERELLANHDEMVRTMREKANVGQTNRADILQSQVAQQRQRVQLRAAENRFKKNWEGLTAMVGAPELSVGGVAGDLEESLPEIDWPTALRHIFEHSPQLKVARAEVLRDEITVQRERVQPIPNAFLRVESGYNWEVNLTTVGVQYGWNFPIWNRNQGTIREAMAEVSRARAEVSRLELWLRQKLAEVYARYETALATVQIYRAETIPQAREAYQLTFDGYRQRRTPWADVVLSQRAYSDLIEEYIDTLLELRHAEIEINGMMLFDGLSRPEPPTPGGHIDATPQPR